MSCCSIFWSGGSRGVLLRLVLRPLFHMFLEQTASEPPLDPEGPGERPTTQCQLEAVVRGVQVRPSSRRASLRIGDDFGAISQVVGDDAQQLDLG